ncbi:MAG: hypothetical protein KF791_02055 [Verrucomicrobiae bacterium]|nr:hypothetical protein [Verrucomicrobiae bacterium]
MLLAATVLYLPIDAATIEYWVKPPGSGSGGNGSSEQKAAVYSGTELHDKLSSNLGDDLVIYFLPGDYLISSVGSAQSIPLYCDVNANVANRSVSLIGKPHPTTGARPRLILSTAIQSSVWTASIAHHTLITTPTYPDGRKSYLKHVSIHDLDLDGNFPALGAWTSEANATGYKSFAIDVAAESGWFKNLRVRNFGAVGLVPNSYIHVTAGVEAFPVVFNTVLTSSNQTVNGTPFCWIVEDCEVSDFHSVHGGYGTMIMANAYQAAQGSLTDNPRVVIRRCQVRVNQHAIGFGSAGTCSGSECKRPFPNTANLPGGPSGRIRFHDNVVLGTGTGFNTDTGWLGPIFFDNNAFLDTAIMGSFGEAGTNPSNPSPHDSYRLRENLVRLRGRPVAKTWTDITMANYPNHATDPNLGLGRFHHEESPANSLSHGLMIKGTAGNILLEKNRFTTWPKGNFYLPAPDSNDHENYRLVWKIPGGQNINSWIYSRVRAAVQPMTFTDNRLSKSSYDFGTLNVGTSFDNLNSETESSLTHTSSSPHAADHLNLKIPSIILPASGAFDPRGTLGRVHLNLTGGTDLESVQEIQIGQPVYNSGTATLTVPGRVVRHVIPRGGIVGGTAAVSEVPVRLRYERRAENFTEATMVSLAAINSSTSGLVTFNLPGVPNNWSGVLRFTMWVDGGTGGQGTFEPHADSWATLNFPLATPQGKPVVELTASPDVSDDKNTSAAKRAVIKVRRSVTTSSSLTVKLTLNSLEMNQSGFTKPGSNPPQDLAGTYGTSGTADYYVINGTGTWKAPTSTSPAEITIASNQAEGTVQVVTRADNLTEQNLIVCELVNNGGAYAPGISSRVPILIFDGPEWNIVELSGLDYETTALGAALAVNAGVISGSAWSVPPQAVGRVTWTGAEHGVLWLPSTLPATDFGLTFRPSGISFRSGLSTKSKVVGSLGTSAYLINDDNTGGTTLPHFPLGGAPSRAWAISPDGARAVGSSTSPNGKTRAAMWVGTTAAVDISSGLEDPMNLRIGEGRAVNNAGVIVGWTSGFPSGGPSVQRPFRNTGNGAVLSDTDYLAVPEGGSGEGGANAVTTSESAHHAAGWFRLSDINQRVGARWVPASGVTLPSVPVNLSRLERGAGALDLRSEAMGINSSRLVVGWSGPSETHNNRRAVFHAGATWKDFNDRRFTHGAGWELRSANSIGDTRVVAGEGVQSGVQKGFILVPRLPGN